MRPLLPLERQTTPPPRPSGPGSLLAGLVLIITAGGLAALLWR